MLRNVRVWINWKWSGFKEAALLHMARALPKPLRYWATIVSCAEASSGEWSNQVVPDMLAMDVLKRIEKR